MEGWNEGGRNAEEGTEDRGLRSDNGRLKARKPGQRPLYRRWGQVWQFRWRAEAGGRAGRGRAVHRQPVVVCVGGQGFTRGAREKGYDDVAEEPGGVGLELLFERVEEGLLVAFFAEHAVERRESLGASA